jgi:hypothetical protein
MPVRSHKEHAIVCQRQGVTLMLATSEYDEDGLYRFLIEWVTTRPTGS